MAHHLLQISNTTEAIPNSIWIVRMWLFARTMDRRSRKEKTQVTKAFSFQSYLKSKCKLPITASLIHLDIPADAKLFE